MTKNINVKTTIANNGYLVHAITGVSMLPLLRQNTDAVHIVLPQGRLKRDDIALYERKSGILVLHRVVKVLPDSYIIRGDNCAYIERIKDEQIIGVAQGVYRDGKFYSCQDKEITKYATRQRWTLPLRMIRYYAKAIKKKLIH